MRRADTSVAKTATLRGVLIASLTVGSLLLAPLSASGAATPAPTPTPTSTPTPTPIAIQTPTSTTTLTPGAVPDSVAVSNAQSGPLNRVSRIIVKYRDGVVATMEAGKPVGWDRAKTIGIVGGAELTGQISTMDLALPVDVATAQRVADEIAQNPDIEWAEPDGWRQIVSDVTPMASTVDVAVIGSTGSATKTGAFSYVDAPLPSSSFISPTAGPLGGGTVVTLTGANLMGASQVTVGGSLATAVTVIDSTHVRFTVPAKAAGSYPIVVTTPAGASSPLSPGFTFVAPPTISSFTPSSGSSVGGTIVTITGSNLANATSVRFGAKTATIRIGSNTATSVSVNTPVGTVSSAVSVSVTTVGGSATKSCPTPAGTCVAKYRYIASKAKTLGATTNAETNATNAVTPKTESIVAPSRDVSVSTVHPLDTSCPLSTATVRIQRCYSDSTTDGTTSLSSNEEIVYTDWYVTAANRATLVMDIVPKLPVPNDAWLARSKSDMYVLFDTNTDGVWDVGIRAPNTSAPVPAGASLAANVMDHAPGSNVPTYRPIPAGGKVCSATLTRKSGTHAFTSSSSWWQFTADWQCLFGSSENATSVDASAFLADTFITGFGPLGDWSPESFGGPSMNLPAALIDPPVISSVTPSTGTRTGGTSVTINGTGLADMSKVTIGGQSATIISKTATKIVVTAPAELAATVTPTESHYVDKSTNGLWGLTKSSFGINVEPAWTKTQGNANVIVAIIDTGITAHPDLGPQVPGYDMVSDATYANDANSRDSNPADPGDWVSAAESATTGGPFEGCDVSWSSWHGTHVAGTVNALINGSGSVGVAPRVRVEPIRALGKCGGSTSDIVAAIVWAAGGSVAGVPTNPNPANVISMSLGGNGTCSAAEQAAINFARGRGVTVVVAAGNDGADASASSPASCDGVITVGATNDAGKRASFSNFGSIVEISAPGTSIYSTLNAGLTNPIVPAGLGDAAYEFYQGTSMATPHVAGVVALMLSRNPTLTPDQVLQRIQSTSTAFAGGVCDVVVAKTCGSGIINASLAVQ